MHRPGHIRKMLFREILKQICNFNVPHQVAALQKKMIFTKVFIYFNYWTIKMNHMTTKHQKTRFVTTQIIFSDSSNLQNILLKQNLKSLFLIQTNFDSSGYVFFFYLLLKPLRDFMHTLYSDRRCSPISIFCVALKIKTRRKDESNDNAY